MASLTKSQRDNVHYFFNYLRAMYKHKLKYSSTEEILNEKEVWSPEICQFNRKQIDWMLSEARQKLIQQDSDFLWPNIPLILNIGHEQALRRLGAPPVKEAYDQLLTAINRGNLPSLPGPLWATYQEINKVRGREFQEADVKAGKAMFADAYATILKQVRDGKKFESAPIPIEQKYVPSDPTVVRANMAKINALLGEVEPS